MFVHSLILSLPPMLSRFRDAFYFRCCWVKPANRFAKIRAHALAHLCDLQCLAVACGTSPQRRLMQPLRLFRALTYAHTCVRACIQSCACVGHALKLVPQHGVIEDTQDLSTSCVYWHQFTSDSIEVAFAPQFATNACVPSTWACKEHQNLRRGRWS